MTYEHTRADQRILQDKEDRHWLVEDMPLCIYCGDRTEEACSSPPPDVCHGWAERALMRQQKALANREASEGEPGR